MNVALNPTKYNYQENLFKSSVSVQPTCQHVQYCLIHVSRTREPPCTHQAHHFRSSQLGPLTPYESNEQEHILVCNQSDFKEAKIPQGKIFNVLRNVETR